MNIYLYETSDLYSRHCDFASLTSMLFIDSCKIGSNINDNHKTRLSTTAHMLIFCNRHLQMKNVEASERTHSKKKKKLQGANKDRRLAKKCTVIQK